MQWQQQATKQRQLAISTERTVIQCALSRIVNAFFSYFLSFPSANHIVGWFLVIIDFNKLHRCVCLFSLFRCLYWSGSHHSWAISKQTALTEKLKEE